MASPNTVAVLFADPPQQWGLRGDPYLWAEMRERFSEVPLPATEEVLHRALGKAFEELTGQPIEVDDFIKIPRYPVSFPIR